MNKVEELKVTGKIIGSRSIVQEGTYKLQVERVTPVGFDPSITHIVNLKGMTAYHESEAKRLVLEALSIADDAEYERFSTLKEAIDAGVKSAELIQAARNQQLTTNVRSGNFIPAKSEFIKVNTAKVTTKNNVTGIFITSYTEMQAEVGIKSTFDLETLIEDSVDVLDVTKIQAEVGKGSPFGEG